MSNSLKHSNVKSYQVANELLGDISSLSFFSRSDELPKIYTSLAKSFVKLSQVADLGRCSSMFYTGVSEAQQQISSPPLIGGENVSSYRWELIEDAFKVVIASPSGLSVGVIEESAKTCGYVGRLLEYFARLDGNNLLKPTEKSKVDKINGLSNWGSGKLRTLDRGVLSGLENAVFKSIKVLTGVPVERLRSYFGAKNKLSSFIPKFSEVLRPRLIDFMRRLAPNVPEYTSMIDANAAEGDVQILNGFSEVYQGMRKVIDNEENDKDVDQVAMKMRYPYAEQFLREFQPTAENPSTISRLVEAMLKSSLVSSVRDPSSLFNGSGTEPNYDLASRDIIQKIDGYSQNKFEKFYMAFGALYVLSHGLEH